MKGWYYFVLTENCNLECAHCYMNAGPGKKDTTISQHDFEKCINHLPPLGADLILTGGEVFTIKNQLYGFLDYLKYTNAQRQRKNQGQLEVRIQTNGFWAKSDALAKKTVKELVDLGVVDFDISSWDKFHREQGIKEEWLDKIYYEATELGLKDKAISIRGALKKNVFPMGRGNSIHKYFPHLTYSMDCKKALDTYDLTIHPDGKVYNCCFSICNLPGNLIKEPLTKIIAKAKKDPRFIAIKKGGVVELAVNEGLFTRPEAQQLAKKYSKCGFCALVYAC
jgi:MoaA/NifB/PqqE/SkfB family radical SAM enzyme